MDGGSSCRLWQGIWCTSERHNGAPSHTQTAKGGEQVRVSPVGQQHVRIDFVDAEQGLLEALRCAHLEIFARFAGREING